MYEVNGYLKFWEEDVYSDGCQSDTGSDYYSPDRFSDDSLENLLTTLLEFCGTDEKENGMLDSCDEAGRFDICTLEDEQGVIASKNEIIEWKEGRQRLYAATYTFHIEKVTREKVSLQDIKLSIAYSR